MRSASPALQSFLASGAPFFSADLFTLTLVSGSVFQWTSFGTDVSANGFDYSSVGPMIQRTSWNVLNTPDVPEMEVQLYANGNEFNGGQNIKMLAHNGLLDGATMLLQRAFMPVVAAGAFPGAVVGTVSLFLGNVSRISINAIGIKITVKGASVVLQQYMPRNQYQLGCIHTLYDVGCTVSQASFSSNWNAGSACTSKYVDWGTDGVPGTPGNFVFGTILMTSGEAVGQLRTVKACDTGGVTPVYPFYNVPAAGDTFTLAMGCDKTMATCSGRFSNIQHFRGFPYIPPAETAV